MALPLPGPSTIAVTFVRNDKRYDIAPNQITASVLSRIFQVDPTNVWLRDELDGHPYFQEDDGTFLLPDLSPFAKLVVEGSPISGHDQGPGSSSHTLHPSSLQQTSQTRFQSLLSSKSAMSTLLKITKARMSIHSKKREFGDGVEAYISIDPSKSNVNYVSSQIKEIWGDDYVLVTADGHEVADCEATRCIEFWKQSARKFFAINSSELHCSYLGKRLREDEESSTLVESLKSVNSKLTSLFNLTSNSKVPVALKILIDDAFKCKICLSIIKPPVIISSCCKSIIGCECCVNMWFGSSPQNDAVLTHEELMLKPCPSCNIPRGYSHTSRLAGLDEFLEALRPLMMTQ